MCIDPEHPDAVCSEDNVEHYLWSKSCIYVEVVHIWILSADGFLGHKVVSNDIKITNI